MAPEQPNGEAWVVSASGDPLGGKSDWREGDASYLVVEVTTPLIAPLHLTFDGPDQFDKYRNS